MMNNEEEHKAQKEQGAGDPESELGMRGFKTFMADVTQETIGASDGFLCNDDGNFTSEEYGFHTESGTWETSGNSINITETSSYMIESYTGGENNVNQCASENVCNPLYDDEGCLMSVTYELQNNGTTLIIHEIEEDMGDEFDDDDEGCIKIIYSRIDTMPSIGGCTDNGAENYNDYATYDNGTCYYGDCW